MKNRPKPGTRSYAAGGEHVIKSDSKKDGFGSEPSKEVTQEELAEAEAKLAKAVADNTKLRQQIKVLQKDNKGKAEISNDE